MSSTFFWPNSLCYRIEGSQPAKLRCSDVSLEFMLFHLNKLSLAFEGKIVSLLVRDSKVQPKETSLIVAKNFETYTRFMVLLGTSYVLLHLVSCCEPFESKTLISTVPFTLTELLLQFVLLMTTEHFLSILMTFCF